MRWGGGGVGVGGGVAASLAALLCCGCVMLALAGAAAAQGPRLPSAYKTLSGKARPCPSATLWTRVRRLLCFSSCFLFIREVPGACFRGLGSRQSRLAMGNSRVPVLESHRGHLPYSSTITGSFLSTDNSQHQLVVIPSGEVECYSCSKSATAFFLGCVQICFLHS